MIELTEPQVWVLIGVFAAAMFGMMGIITTSFNRTLTTAIGSVEQQIQSLRDVLDVRITALETRMTSMESRLDRMEGQITTLDRDVQAIAARVFRDDKP